MSSCQVSVASLVDAVNLCSLATKSRSPSDLTRSIHLSADDRGLSIRATNYVLSIGDTIPAEGEVSGGVLAETFVKAVNGLDGDTATLEKVGTKLVIRGKKRKFDLAIAVMDFPALPNAEGETIALDGGQLAAAIEGVSFVAEAANEAGHWNQCVYLCPDDSGLDVATLDGRRLATQWIAAVGKKGEDRLIGKDHAEAFARVCKEGSSELILGDTIGIVRSGDRWAIAPFVEGVPPAWREFVKPQDGAKVATFDRKSLLAEAKAVSAMMSSENGNDALTVHVSSEAYTLIGGRTESVGRGGGLPIKADPMVLVLDHRFFVEAVARGPGDVVTIAYFGKTSPIQFDTETSHRQLVMSINSEPQPL